MALGPNLTGVATTDDCIKPFWSAEYIAQVAFALPEGMSFTTQGNLTEKYTYVLLKCSSMLPMCKFILTIFKCSDTPSLEAIEMLI